MSILVRWNAFMAATLFSLTLCAPPAAAVAILEASLGFGGYATPGRWTPLWIRCADAPRSSSIQVVRLNAEGKESGIETFPAGGGARLECPVLLADGLAALKVRLVSGSRNLAELDVDGNAGFFPGHLVLACGLPTASRRAVASALMPGEPIVVVPIHLSNLPSNGLDYDGVSALVIGDSDGGKTVQEIALLTLAQRNALLAWIAGGGSLVVAAESSDGARIFDSLELLRPKPDSGESAIGFGFGRYGLVSSVRRPSEVDWRAALGLSPYGSTSMIGPSASLRGVDTELSEPISAPKIRRIIHVALGLWLAAVLAAAIFYRKRVAPLAVVAGICLAAVLAGGGVLERSLVRGSRFKILVLALPDAGTAFVTLRAAAYEATRPYSWLDSKVIGPLSIGFLDEESGTFGSWKHTLGRATFSVAGSGQLTLAGLIARESWRRMLLSSIPSLSASSLPGFSLAPDITGSAGAAVPPLIESPRPLAFLGAGESGPWWTKEPGGPWLRVEEAPVWLAAETNWLVGLKKGRSDAAVLVGTCAASLVGFSFQGAPPPGEVVWAMPLPVEAAR